MKRLLIGASVLVLFSVPGTAQTTRQAQPGFNLFTVQQDIEIGRQSALEAEKQLVLLRDPTVDRYLNRIVQRLAAQAPGAKYPYQIKAVNAPEINAFALPGGPMYVHRGLIEAARSEAELAGVLSHELAHVALRHGTHQASKAYLTKSGLGILGGLVGRSTGSATRVLNAVGGVGLNAVFLKFSRDDEYEADQTGAQLMARAGYDPLAMASFFELLRAEQGRDPGKVEQFFSSHPSPAGREARIRSMAASLTRGQTQVVGGFETIRTRVRGLGQPASQAVVTDTWEDPLEPDTVLTGVVVVNIPPPSTRLVQFRHPSGFFSVSYPDNWRAYRNGLAISLAPDGGVVTRSDGRQAMLYGVILNHYAPFEGVEARRSSSLQRSYIPFEDRNTARGALEEATDDLARTILASNPHLRAESGVAQAEVLDGEAGFSLRLSGISPVTGQQERVMLYTRGLTDGHVMYALAVAPGKDAATVSRTFQQILRSLRVTDAAAHVR